MDMDLINVAIYVCASLGAVLLLLCVILAAFFVYSYCVKYFGPRSRQFVIVPTQDNHEQNGQIVLRKFSSEDLEKSGILSTTSLSFEDECDHQKKQQKNVPPVKKKMLWKQKKKSYQQQSIPFKNQEDIKFNEEELKVPKERLFKSKLKEKRKSKSDWDLYDSNSSEESLSLIRNLDTQQSQYFDALDTIEENEEDETDDNLSDLDEAATLVAESWIDLTDSESEETETKPQQKQSKKRKFPPVIQRRINALKVLQLEQMALETKFYVALYELEASRNFKLKEPLYEKRNKVINQKDEFGEPGIETFWLHAMDNCENLKDIIQLHDRPILKHLQDIKIKTSPLGLKSGEKSSSDNMGFRIEFYFSKNEFFENAVLFKDYALRCELDMADPWSFQGPEVCNCKGCKISWFKGKNATLRPVRKLKDGQIVTKWAKRNSFFNFFTPPKMTRETMLDPAKRSLFEAHFQLGLYLKETFVPKAYLIFMNAQKARKISQDSKSPKKKAPISKPQKSNAEVTKIVEKQHGESNGEVIKMAEKQNGEAPKIEPIVEVLPPPAADPIVGRYRLLKSENFDEFMKKLGVGLVKRKLANSVSPMNVIIVNEDGSYTVRTESTVRTTELNFSLGVPFQEETLDGRITSTIASRIGNVLTLDQKGDPTKKEMDSKQIRDFQGDKMMMSLVAQDVVCFRYYEKVKE